MTKIPVLDKGFIELIDSMGDDRMVVNAARVSFAKETLVLNESDEKLIRYLLQHKHVSPFYHPQLQFRVKAPISVGRQWFKHKIGTAENSESTRYIEVHDEFYVPDVFRGQSQTNKQGSSGALSVAGDRLSRLTYESSIYDSFEAYRRLLSFGVAKEQAREVLPLCVYTTWIWTASLQAVIHFLKLRDESHAQHEIRQYAVAMRTIAEQIFPATFKVLMELGELPVRYPGKVQDTPTAPLVVDALHNPLPGIS